MTRSRHFSTGNIFHMWEHFSTELGKMFPVAHQEEHFCPRCRARISILLQPRVGSVVQYQVSYML